MAEGSRPRSIADAYQRLCVDLRDLRLVGKFDYHEVPPSQRLWIWEADLAAATHDLALPGPVNPRRVGERR
jgi:hypothetical protein